MQTTFPTWIVPCLIFAVFFGSTQGLGLNYVVSKNTKCNFNVSEHLSASSAIECAAECGKRRGCKLVNFKRPDCEILISDSVLDSEEDMIEAHGWRCIHETNECASSPCNNGTCIDGKNSYRCTCDQGYRGMNCEDACVDGPYGGDGGSFHNVTSEDAFVVGIKIIKCLNERWGFIGAVGGLTAYFSDGTQVQGLGCMSGESHEVMLEPNEVVTETDIYVDSDVVVALQVVVGLTLRTNLGQEYGPYGWTTGDMYTSRGSQLNGMIVHAGALIDSISFVWECDSD